MIINTNKSYTNCPTITGNREWEFAIINIFSKQAIFICKHRKERASTVGDAPRLIFLQCFKGFVFPNRAPLLLHGIIQE